MHEELVGKLRNVHAQVQAVDKSNTLTPRSVSPARMSK
jgi:hypothetical protein